MATGPRHEATPAWTIRSIPVRTRDGPERLDQAYRRLLSDIPHDTLPDERHAAPAPSPVPDPRR